MAGSMLRGEETDTSDIDIVVILEAAFEQVHRRSVVESGWPIEFFVHNKEASDFFMDKDRRRGMCVMMDMVASGVLMPQKASAANNGTTGREKARALIKEGPPELTGADIEDHRYFITNLIDDLDESKPAIERYGTLANLYNRMDDFYLRAKGRRSGYGKALGRLLSEDHPGFSWHYEEAFAAAFQGELSRIRELADALLRPYGGRCGDGYYCEGQKDWKDFKVRDDL